MGLLPSLNTKVVEKREIHKIKGSNEMKFLRIAWVGYLEKVNPKYETLADYLSKRLGTIVKTDTVGSYNYKYIANRMKTTASPQERIDVAWFTPYTYVLAREIAPIEPFASFMRRREK